MSFKKKERKKFAGKRVSAVKGQKHTSRLGHFKASRCSDNARNVSSTVNIINFLDFRQLIFQSPFSFQGRMDPSSVTGHQSPGSVGDALPARLCSEQTKF